MCIAMFFLEEEVFCCIFNFRVKDEKLVLADIESCVDKMAKMYGNVFFVVGKSFAGMKNIKDCYQKEIKRYGKTGSFILRKNHCLY